nr:integrase, catalytic region, zinc finger, CCHC-type, peptidase aspartic, catalytic [Tanacetum cinerariifolium]
MRGSEYVEQDMNAAILYEYETFKATVGEQLLDTYLRYLQVINDLKKCGYKKDNYPLALVAEKTKVSKHKEKVKVQTESEESDDEDISDLKKITMLLAKDFNRKKYYAKPTNNNLRTSLASFSANKKPEYVKSVEKKEDKKADEKKRDMSKVKCYNCKKEGHFAKDCKKAKVKDYNYYKTKMLLAKKDSDEQVLLAEDQAWMESSNESSSSAKETITEVAYYTSESESESEYETLEYYDNSTNYGLFVNDNDDQEIFHDAIESASENFIENHIDSQKDYDKKKIDEQEILFDKMSRQLVEMNNNVLRIQEKILEKETKISELEGCVSNKDVEIEKCLERLNECENELHKISQTNQTIHMIMPSKDTLYNGRKGIGFENPSYFEKAKDLRPSLYDEKVIGLGYTPMFLIHSDEALEIKKFKRERENKIEFAYNYGNLNASYQTSSLKLYVLTMILEKIIIDLEDEVVSLLKKKANLETIESLKSKGFDSSKNAISESKNQSENDCQVVEKECHTVVNSKVIAPGMFKLSVSQSVSPISMSKTSCDSKNVENKTKRKRRGRKSSKQNDKQVNNDVSRANSEFVHFSNLDTFSSVRRPKQSNIIWKKKDSSNTSNVDLSFVSHSKLNKDVKRYSRKDLLSCNNSLLGETSGAYVCNDAMNVSCNSRLCDSFDENNLFIFDDESVRIFPVSKMPFRKKPHDSMNVCSKSNSNKSLPRTVHRWLPKMQPLAEPVAKWIPRIIQICFWIIDSGCSKHMTSNHALLTNFVEKVSWNGSLWQKLFCGDCRGLEVAFRKSTCFVRNEDCVYLLTGDRSLNLYTIALNEVASNSSTCLLVKASSMQSWLWHQRLSHLNFATINNLVKTNLVQGLPKMKFEKDHLCSACEQRKIHHKHHKSKTAFASNKPLYLLHVDLCGLMRIERINGKLYVLVVVDDYS